MPREPLFPHQPSRREPLFPHTTKGQQPTTEKLYQRAADGYPIGADKIMRDAWGPIPNPYQQFWSEKGFTEPVKIYGWGWSTDYGCWRAYVLFPDKTETWTSPRSYSIGETGALPQTFGGRRIPPEYRTLVDYIDEPLPDAALMTLPVVEVEEGERKLDAVMRSLKNGVETIQSSTNFRQFLTTMAKFHSYSIGNQILIMIQSPEAIRVAGFNTWKELGRWVRKGAKAISILAPRFPPRPTCPKCGASVPRNSKFCPVCGIPIEQEDMEMEPAYFLVVSVFDISQTEGKPLPEFEVPVLTGDVNEGLFTKVENLAAAQGVTIGFEPRPNQDPAIKGIYSGKSIWVRPEEAPAQQLKTLLHELSHYYSEGVFRIPRRDAETIAESAAYVVGAHYGFDTGVRSFPYVALWAKEEKVLKENLASIRKVATTILEGMEKA